MRRELEKHEVIVHNLGVDVLCEVKDSQALGLAAEPDHCPECGSSLASKSGRGAE